LLRLHDARYSYHNHFGKRACEVPADVAIAPTSLASAGLARLRQKPQMRAGRGRARSAISMKNGLQREVIE
jgi:hypothetical protein